MNPWTCPVRWSFSLREGRATAFRPWFRAMRKRMYNNRLARSLIRESGILIIYSVESRIDLYNPLVLRWLL